MHHHPKMSTATDALWASGAGPFLLSTKFEIAKTIDVLPNGDTTVELGGSYDHENTVAALRLLNTNGLVDTSPKRLSDIKQNGYGGKFSEDLAGAESEAAARKDAEQDAEVAKAVTAELTLLLKPVSEGGGGLEDPSVGDADLFAPVAALVALAKKAGVMKMKHVHGAVETYRRDPYRVDDSDKAVIALYGLALIPWKDELAGGDVSMSELLALGLHRHDVEMMKTKTWPTAKAQYDDIKATNDAILDGSEGAMRRYAEAAKTIKDDESEVVALTTAYETEDEVARRLEETAPTAAVQVAADALVVSEAATLAKS